MPDILNSVVDWPFLNEPIWRWFVFLVALSLMSFAWNGVLSLMM